MHSAVLPEAGGAIISFGVIARCLLSNKPHPSSAENKSNRCKTNRPSPGQTQLVPPSD